MIYSSSASKLRLRRLSRLSSHSRMNGSHKRVGIVLRRLRHKQKRCRDRAPQPMEVGTSSIGALVRDVVFRRCLLLNQDSHMRESRTFILLVGIECSIETSQYPVAPARILSGFVRFGPLDWRPSDAVTGPLVTRR